MSENLIRLEVVTPEKIVFSENVYGITVPGTLGELGILPGHIPIVSDLVIGTVSYKLDNGESHHIFICDGFLEVKDDKAVILTKVSEIGCQIDVDRAEKAKSRAEERLSKKDDSGIDVMRAEVALKKAISRIRSAE